MWCKTSWIHPLWNGSYRLFLSFFYTTKNDLLTPLFYYYLYNDQRESLKSDLDSKLNIIFQNYGQELEQVQQMYERDKHDPPIPRNLPPVAGNITWSRHLLKRIEEPMKQFESNQNVLAGKDAKRIIKMYNKVAKVSFLISSISSPFFFNFSSSPLPQTFEPSFFQLLPSCNPLRLILSPSLPLPISLFLSPSRPFSHRP